VAAQTIPSLKFERQAWRSGALLVAGVDEVGVGPLAGPVAAGVVVLEPSRKFPWFSKVRDSKVLTAAMREALAEQIADSVPFAVGWASVEEIDRIGILPARRLCMLRAIEQLPCPPAAVISDALDLPLPDVRAIVKADAQCVSVAAASIVAKVARDALMVEFCDRYHGFGFCQNKGYATEFHRRALQRRGPTEIHRKSFAPVAQKSFGW
jgi:ribonuclease HII